MVSKDYYNILGLQRQATTDEIAKAYRTLALRYHPDKTQEASAREKFNEVAEAYTVLSHPERKAIFDKYGYEGLRTGAPKGDTEFTEGYTFHGNAIRVFQDFFGTDNPFHDIFPPVDEFKLRKEQGFRTKAQQDPAVERDLLITLEEAYLGCIKKMKITRKVLNEDGHTTTTKDKVLSVQVKPGWKEDTKITFPKEGDQGPNNIPADIVFILKYRPHPRFKRQGNDLIHVVDLPLVNALTGSIVELVTLDGRKLSVPVHDIVHPAYEVKIPNEGMPIPKTPEQKGDLILKFNVVFPTSLTEHQKLTVKDALKP